MLHRISCVFAILNLFGFLATPSAAIAAPSGQTHALLIGIGDYQQASDFGDLFADNDLDLMKEALAWHGISGKDQVQTLRNQEASATGIRRAFKALMDRTHPGDVAIVYYTGHGDRVRGSNDEADTLDEGWVTGSGAFFRDDEIGELLDALREDLGPTGHALVIFDTCYSAGATRGEFSHKGPSRLDSAASAEGNERLTIESEWLTKETARASLTFLAASASNQVAEQDCLRPYCIDRQGAGRFTICLHRALSQSTADETYLQLFYRIKALMARRGVQQPSLHGERALRLFSGHAIDQIALTKVTGVDQSGRLRLKVGRLHGLTEGTTVFLMAPDARQPPGPTTALGIGEVAWVDPLSAVVLVRHNRAPDPQAFRDAEVFIAQAALDPQLRVNLDVPDGMDDALREAFRDAQLPITPRAADYTIRFIAPTEVWVIEDAQGAAVFEHPQIPPLIDALHAYAQIAYLRSMGTRSSSIVDVEGSLYPCTPRGLESNTRCEPITSPLIVDSDHVTLTVGDYYGLQFTNTGSEEIYVTALSADPKNGVSVLYPLADTPADPLPAGASFSPRAFWRVNEATEETLVFLATQQPIPRYDQLNRAPSPNKRSAPVSYAAETQPPNPPVIDRLTLTIRDPGGSP